MGMDTMKKMKWLEWSKVVVTMIIVSGAFCSRSATVLQSDSQSRNLCFCIYGLPTCCSCDLCCSFAFYFERGNTKNLRWSSLVQARSFLAPQPGRYHIHLVCWTRMDRSVCIATGEALALNFEMESVEKFGGDATDGSKPQEGFPHIQGLKGKVINQVRNLSAEAGGKGSAKKDLNSQRKLFRDILDFFDVLYKN